MGAKNEVGEFPGVNGRLPQGHDRSSPISLISFISNRVIQELSPPTKGGTPLGYLTGMITENRRA